MWIQGKQYFCCMNVPVVFYDGECGFCNRTVQFILDHERRSEVHFCALQSDAARVFFAEKNFPKPDLSTFYFWDGREMFERSTGALHVATHLKFPFSWVRIGWILPRFMRDGMYNWIAKRRHKLSKQQCALPTPEQRKRFIG